ncbi:hypothetical protein [Rhodococcus opacus]
MLGDDDVSANLISLNAPNDLPATTRACGRFLFDDVGNSCCVLGWPVVPVWPPRWMGVTGRVNGNRRTAELEGGEAPGVRALTSTVEEGRSRARRPQTIELTPWSPWWTSCR